MLESIKLGVEKVPLVLQDKALASGLLQFVLELLDDCDGGFLVGVAVVEGCVTGRQLFLLMIGLRDQRLDLHVNLLADVCSTTIRK